MTEPFMSHLAVPIASERDAVATCDGLESVLDESVERVTIVHVIERTAGYPDVTPLEARERAAERIFAPVEERFHDRVSVRRVLRYGTDPVDEILAAAETVGATAIGFTHRPDSRLWGLLSRSDAYRLATESDQPVVVFSRDESRDTNETDS